MQLLLLLQLQLLLLLQLQLLCCSCSCSCCCSCCCTFYSPSQNSVISTEAVHSPIVNCAAEKPASPPTPHPSHKPLFLPFLFVIPEGDLQLQLLFAVAVAFCSCSCSCSCRCRCTFYSPNPNTVISTEAVHSPIVNCAAEKPASPPTPHPSHKPLFLPSLFVTLAFATRKII